SGDTLAVADEWDASGRFDVATVDVFRRAAGAWAEEATLHPTPLVSNGEGPVALDGDTLLATALGSPTEIGAVAVFVRSGTFWTRQARLTAPRQADETG